MRCCSLLRPAGNTTLENRPTYHITSFTAQHGKHCSARVSTSASAQTASFQPHLHLSSTRCIPRRLLTHDDGRPLRQQAAARAPICYSCPRSSCRSLCRSSGGHQPTFADQALHICFPHSSLAMWWIRNDPCGLFSAFLTVVLLLYSQYVITTVILLPWYGAHYHLAIYSLVTVLSLVSHTRAQFTNPGVVPRHLRATAVAADGTEAQPRTCRRCRAVKPYAAHHCSTCARCIIRMDHRHYTSTPNHNRHTPHITHIPCTMQPPSSRLTATL